MLPEGPPTIADIESLQAQITAELKAEKVNPDHGWPDNFLAIINNMIERVPSFLPGEPGQANVAVADIVDDAAVQSSKDNVKKNLGELNRLIQERDAKEKRMCWKRAYLTLEWMTKVLMYRGELEGAQQRRAAAQGAPMGGKRRSARRGRKSRRKSLRQRK